MVERIQRQIQRWDREKKQQQDDAVDGADNRPRSGEAIEGARRVAKGRSSYMVCYNIPYEVEVMIRNVLVFPFLFSLIPAVDHAEERHLGLHVHGQATVNISTETNVLAVELSLPGHEVVGFESPPGDAGEKVQLGKALAALNGAQWLQPAGDADCRLSSAKVEPHGFGGASEAGGTRTSTRNTVLSARTLTRSIISMSVSLSPSLRSGRWWSASSPPMAVPSKHSKALPMESRCTNDFQRPISAVKTLGLCHRWAGSGATLALEDFELSPCERLILCGSRGSGKSMPLGLLSGVLTPAGGDVVVLGSSFANMHHARRERTLPSHCQSFDPHYPSSLPLTCA